MKNSCINHKDRPPFIETGKGQICAECYYGYEGFVQKYRCTPEEFYEKWSKNDNS